MNTLLKRSLRLTVAGAMILGATVAFGQRFVSINDLGAGHASHVNEFGDVAGWLPGNPLFGQTHQAAISRDGGALQPVGIIDGFESVATCIIPGGPSGTRIVIGNVAFGGDQGFVTILNPDNSWGGLVFLGQASLAPDVRLTNSPLGAHYKSPMWDENLGSFQGRSRAHSVVQAATDVPMGDDGFGNPVLNDVYFVVGEYEWDANVWHACMWRVTVPVDSYSNFPSGVDSVLYDLHAALPSNDPVHDFDAGTSSAMTISKYSEKARGQVTNWVAISGSQTTTLTDPESAVLWKMSAVEMPDIYQVGTAQSLWTGGKAQGLYYRRDKDSATKPFVGYFVGTRNGKAASQILDGTVVEQAAGEFCSVGLDGIDRGNPWAVGEIGGVAKLYQFSPGTLTSLSSFLPTSTPWESLTEASSMCGRVIVGTGMIGGVEHAYRLTLRK